MFLLNHVATPRQYTIPNFLLKKKLISKSPNVKRSLFCSIFPTKRKASLCWCCEEFNNYSYVMWLCHNDSVVPYHRDVGLMMLWRYMAIQKISISFYCLGMAHCSFWSHGGLHLYSFIGFGSLEYITLSCRWSYPFPTGRKELNF